MRRCKLKVAVTILALVFYHNIALGQISDNRDSYTVKKGDTLIMIAEKLGDRDFWEPLYRANTDIIDKGLQPGQVLKLPPSITDSPNFVYSKDSKNTTRENQLEKFRAAFNKVVGKKKESASNPETQKEESKQVDPTLDLGTFILDGTRSKLGGDFYNLFYQYWQAPEEASNVSITISEKPSFGRGTQVIIKIDYEQVFRARLQPRYEYIEAVSKQAVARTQRIIQQRTSVRRQLMGF